MPRCKYLIVGGGMTADAAVRGIRQIDRTGEILLIGAEPHPPYNRPPLSKTLWQGRPLESIWRKTPTDGVELRLGRTVVGIDPRRKRAADDQGTEYAFDKLLLATGGTVRRLPVASEHIIYLRTLDDYQRIRALADHGQRFAVIGGGFIGAEMAASLAANGKQVVMVFPEQGITQRVFPPDIACWLADLYRRNGVVVSAGADVGGVQPRGDRYAVQIRPAGGAAQREELVDGVVAGIGIEPNVELAGAAGLAVDNGIAVDECLRTSRADIFAAGDVASFPSAVLGRRVRVEHEDNTNMMGRAAGRAMAGEAVPYRHIPSFYSWAFDLRYEAVGELDPRHEVVADWKEPYRQGVLYYLHAGRVRGVLAWNVRGLMEPARQLVADPGPFTAESIRGRLPFERAKP